MNIKPKKTHLIRLFGINQHFIAEIDDALQQKSKFSVCCFFNTYMVNGSLKFTRYYHLKSDQTRVTCNNQEICLIQY